MNPLGPIKKAFQIFKKQSAAPPKAADAPFEHDDNVVLVFGHSNAGKTVYFSVLYELLKGNEEFKLSPLNNETAANLIENYNLMRGKLLRIREGRQVEIEGERKFPTMTSETRILKFGLDMTIRKGIKFYTVDYKGETLSIAEPGGLRKQFAKFFPFARAALFFIDASVLDTDVLLREQIAAFQTILHDLRDCVPKKIPVGIVITKADFLEGYSHANPVELIPKSASVYKGRGKESFIKGLAGMNKQRFGEVWARSTERASRTLANLIDSVSAYTLDFQFFFVSSTGGLMKRQSGEIEPPRDLTPHGVPDPLRWAFGRILFNKRKAFWWYLTKWAMALCFIWIALYSVLNLYHQLTLYGDLEKADDYVREKLKPTDEVDITPYYQMAKDNYKKYDDRLVVSNFLGAKPLRDFVQLRFQLIDQMKSAQETRQRLADQEAEKSGKPKKAPPKPPADPRTAAAAKEFEDLKKSISAKPMAEREGALTAGIAALWAKYPKDSLDAGFVKQVDGYPDEYKKAVADAQQKTYTFTVRVDNIRPKSKVVIQIGDGQPVDFTNFIGDSPKSVSGEVSGAGNAPIKFTFVDRSESAMEPIPSSEPDPLEKFYPKIKAEGYKLDFDKGYGIIVKYVSGETPSIP